MKPNKSHNVELSDKEFKLIEALKENPEMLDELTSVAQKFNEDVDNGMDAHEAECHVIKFIQEIGKSMITRWAERTQNKAVEKATSSAYIIKNGKKTLLVLHPRTNLL